MSSLYTNFNRDFLDVLRELNEGNINDDPQKRDEFFRCLYPYKKFPYYQNDYMGSEFKAFIMEKLNNLINPSNSSNLKSEADEIFNEAMENAISFFKSCLYAIRKNDRDNTYYIDNDPNYGFNTRVNELAIECSGYIEVIRYLIEKIDPSYFERFKKEFIEALAVNLCGKYNNNIFTGIRRLYKKEDYYIILNKVIAIYAEENGYLKFGDEIPQLIDDEFLGQLDEFNALKNIDANYAYERVLEILNNLCERKKLSFKAK